MNRFGRYIRLFVTATWVVGRWESVPCINPYNGQPFQPSVGIQAMCAEKKYKRMMREFGSMKEALEFRKGCDPILNVRMSEEIMFCTEWKITK